MPPLATPPATSLALPSRAWRRAEWSAAALLLVGAALLVSLRPDKAIDFRVYWLNARHYFSGASAMYGPASGTRWTGGVYRYPPLFLDLFRPLAALPLVWGVLIWAVAKVVCGWLTVVALARRWQVASPLLLWPGLLLLAPYLIQELRFGNLQLFIVLLVIWACLLTERRPWTAGALLGLAVALKVWPLFFLPCLLALRRWRFALSAAFASIAWTLLPMLWRGPVAQVRLLGLWLAQERSIAAAAARTIGFWYPGQSLHDVLARYLAVVDYSQLPDSRYRQVAWLHLSALSFQVVWWAVAAILTVALLLTLARHAQASRGSLEASRAERAPAADHRSPPASDQRERLNKKWRATWDAAVAFLFCALLVLQPHVHRIIFVSLLWPSLWLAAQRLGRRLSRFESALYGLAVAAAVVQPLIPGSATQRLLQVYGADFWLVLLPLCAITASQFSRSVLPLSQAQRRSGVSGARASQSR